MPKQSPFTICPRCGYTTVQAVYCCLRCGHTVPRRGAAAGIVFAVVTIALMALILNLAWRRFASLPPRFLGAWTDGRVFFTLNPDGTAETNAVFVRGDATSAFEVGKGPLKGRWSTVGDLLRLSLPAPGSRAFEPPQLLRWSLAQDGRLTLTRVDSYGTLLASTTLHRRASALHGRQNGLR